MVLAGRGGQDRGPNIDPHSIPCHACDARFKAGWSWRSRFLHPWPPSEEDLARCSACNPDPDSCPCIPESSSCLLLRTVWDLLVLPSGCWQEPARSTQLQETHYQFCIFYIISLIINIISIISIISKTSYILFVSLSPFSSFSLSLVGGWGLIESICHSVY